MEFEWDSAKAVRNLKKHGVSFDEAWTVFGDALAITYFDPDHSEEEDRFLTFGHSRGGELLVLMKKNSKKTEETDLRREYDLAELKGGVRGKYLARYRAGTNLAFLAPDVRAAFPTDESVNEALRSLIKGRKPA